MSRSDEYAERLTEFGVPVDAVQGLVREELANAVNAANAISQSPAGQWLSANQRELSGFLQSRPELGAQVGRLAQADPLGAIEFLRMKVESEGGARSSTGSGATTLLPQAWGQPAGGVEEAMQRYQRDGSKRSAEQYARARLGPLLQKQFRDSGQNLDGDPTIFG